jgi:hypothetical protein
MGPAGGERAVHLLQEGGDRLLGQQVLEEVRDPDAVEVSLGQVGLEDVRRAHARVGGMGALLVGHGVDGLPLGRRDVVDELAAARRRVEDLLRATQFVVDVRGDLLPDLGARVLVDAAEAPLVEPLLVHGVRARCTRRSWSCTTRADRPPAPARGRHLDVAAAVVATAQVVLEERVRMPRSENEAALDPVNPAPPVMRTGAITAGTPLVRRCATSAWRSSRRTGSGPRSEQGHADGSCSWCGEAASGTRL